jgi:hypothetical protein
MPGLKVNAYFVTLSNGEGARFLAEPVLSNMRFFATLRMTGSEGLRMTGGVAKQPLKLKEVEEWSIKHQLRHTQEQLGK